MNRVIEIRTLVFVYMRSGLKIVTSDRLLLVIDLIVVPGTTFAMQYLIWSYIFDRGSPTLLNGVSFSGVMMYYLYTVCWHRLNNGYDVIDDLFFKVHSGRIDTNLLKPLHYVLQEFLLHIGQGFPYILVLIFPMAWQIIILGDFSFSFLLHFVPLVILSQVLCFQAAFFLGIFTLAIKKAGFVLGFYGLLLSFFGGNLLPVRFWPKQILLLMKYNPFYLTMGGLSEYAVSPQTVSVLELYLGLSGYVGLFSILIIFSWKRLIGKYQGTGG